MSAFVAYTTRRQEQIDKTGSNDVKIGSDRPHSAYTIANVSRKFCLHNS